MYWSFNTFLTFLQITSLFNKAYTSRTALASNSGQILLLQTIGTRSISIGAPNFFCASIILNLSAFEPRTILKLFKRFKEYVPIFVGREVYDCIVRYTQLYEVWKKERVHICDSMHANDTEKQHRTKLQDYIWAFFTLLQLQYQNSCKAFLAKNFEFQCLCRHDSGKWEVSCTLDKKILVNKSETVTGQLR